jgi:hypothetical protein
MQGKDEKIQDGQKGMLKTGEKIRQRRTGLMNSIENNALIFRNMH